MTKSITYIRNVAAGLIAMLVIFVGAGAIAVVLGALSWDELADWSVKAVLIAGIVLIVNAVGGLLVGLVTKPDTPSK